jgi:hypothetical protein
MWAGLCYLQWGKKPLHWACGMGILEIVTVLIAAGAKLEEKDKVSIVSSPQRTHNRLCMALDMMKCDVMCSWSMYTFWAGVSGNNAGWAMLSTGGLDATSLGV